MQLKRLTLTYFRVFEQATFSFRPGINLLVGINGVGKSSVLDALCVLLSQALPRFTVSQIRARTFGASDITVGSDDLTAELDWRQRVSLLNKCCIHLIGRLEAIAKTKRRRA